jgi:hypothetical protein
MHRICPFPPGCAKTRRLRRCRAWVGHVETEQLHGGRQAFLRPEVEDHAGVGLHGQPGVLRQFLLQLAGRPARVAEEDHGVGRHSGLADRNQDIAGTGQRHLVTDPQAGLPRTGRAMQDKAAVGLDRTAEIGHALGKVATFDRNVDPVEQVGEGHVDGAIDDDTECAIAVVLANIG